MKKRDINDEKDVQITNVAKQIEVKFLGQNYDYGIQRAIHGINFFIAWLKWWKTGIVVTSSFNFT